MKNFSKIKFKGTFRHYQQNVLDNTLTHLEDGKIHIVAAPGSGKTTLGIELIRYLNKPALILSPSLTIRNQWGDRVEQGFLSDSADVDDYVSYSLKKPKLLTSITYQGLHAAFNKLLDQEENDSELIEQKKVIDYLDYDLIKTMRFYGITTICLDEAHHLRSEWYKTLTAFIRKCGNKITIISLTATPPYDSSVQEWKRYMSLCGTIDEEIFVPELIAQKNLCPHQDYIYFNYPSTEEKEDLRDYKKRAITTLDKIIKNKIFKKMMEAFLKDYLNPKYNLFEDIQQYYTLVSIAKSRSKHIPGKLKKILKERHFLNKYDIEHVEILFRYIIEHPGAFGEIASKFVDSTLKEQGLIEKKQVKLEQNTRLMKTLVSSIGKLRSIADIAKFESEKLKTELRMLILTDYIKKDLLDIIGTDEDNTVIGSVPIFEEVRRNVNNDIRIVLLTGSLIIVPECILKELEKVAKLTNSHFTTKKLPNVPYRMVRFQTSNKHKVSILTQIFEAGFIEVLIGTKSLLGEGWDSPSINTLILASFVGSFMLSNQMRGRAIRVDKSKPKKIASIWHLATIEPSFLEVDKVAKSNQLQVIDEKTEIVSHDFHTLTRRFKTFLGPIFTKPGIESGIERVDIIKPIYGEKKFKEINKTMFKYAADRNAVRDKWKAAVRKEVEHEILDVSQVPPKVWPLDIFIVDALLILFVTALGLLVGYLLYPILIKSNIGKGFGLLYILIYVIFLFMYLPKATGNFSPKRSVHSLGKILLETLKSLGKIKTLKSKVSTKKDFRTRHINCSLINSTRRDKSVFAASINEMMTQIDNPRYVIIKKRKIGKKTYYNYSNSYSVPKDLSTNKESVELLAKNLKRVKGRYAVVYTRSVEGRETLLKCKKKSKLSRHLIQVRSNRVLR
ncbi:DEAD/DEAH box helicase family protein [Mycoplasmatota bacterium WC30]